MCPPGHDAWEKLVTDNGQTRAIWAPGERASERELAMDVSDLGTALALTCWLLCWGFASGPANDAGCGAWARPAGQVLWGLMAPAGDELAWSGSASPGGNVQGKKGAELASASK